MTHEIPRDDASANDASSLRDRFPWHFGPPSGAQLERFLTKGMVVPDANALFDAYRLNLRGRAEFLHTLGLLGDQLWVPERIVDEFLKHRLTVISECAGAVKTLNKDLDSSFRKIKADIQKFGGRRGLGQDQVNELLKLLGKAHTQIIDKVGEFYQFDLKEADCQDDDPILSDIEKLLKGRVGPPLMDMQKVREDAAYRFERRIPPGYADTDKPPEQAIGDYVLWVQLLQEVERLPRPVLFVTNERKRAQDWVVQQPGGRSPLPRPELSAELWEQARQPFHIINVRSFLELANKYLNAQVSAQTITQAQEIVETTTVPTLSPSDQYLYASMLRKHHFATPDVVAPTRTYKVLAEHLAKYPPDSPEARFLHGDLSKTDKPLPWHVLVKVIYESFMQLRADNLATTVDPDPPEDEPQ